MAITALPTPPSRNDPTNFSTRADAFLGALPAFGTEANALAVEVNANAVTAAADADIAEASANAAIAVAGAEAWVSGTTYAIGDAVWSPITLHTYRRKTTGGGTTDPSLDVENWTALTGAAAGGTVAATASGSISIGSPVIVNSNGTVSAVSGSAEITFSSGSVSDTKIAYDPVNAKVVVVYTDEADADRGKAIVGTVSGTSITYGSPVNFSNGASAYTPSICFDSVNNKFVIFYRLASTFGSSVVGTVSGTTISFGTPVTYNSGASYFNCATFDAASGKALVFYNEGAGDSGGYGRAGTVSGTTISFGSAALLLGGSNVRHLGCGYDVGQSKTIVGFCDVNTNRNAAVVVASVSGSTISYGTKATTNQGSNTVNDFVYDSASQQMIYGFTAGGPLKACTVAISGTTATINSAANISSGTVNYFGISYDTSLQKVVASYGESSGSTGQIKVGTVSGTSITFGTASQFNAGTQYVSSAYAANSSSVVVVYRDVSNSNRGTSQSVVGGALTNLTTTNYIGFSAAAYANGQTATIQVVGSTNGDQSSLTPGLPYYVTPSGGLSLSAGVPSVLAGTAVASTKIIIKG